MQAKELGHPETLTRIAQYELAFRMQTLGARGDGHRRRSRRRRSRRTARSRAAASFANNCLLARRLVEQGVRFVQLFDWGWDFHGTSPGEDIRDGLTKKCATMDQPVAALIKDLKRAACSTTTLVVWGGEFGRTPFREGRTAGGKLLGRDHYPDCYSMVHGRRRHQGRASRTASRDDLGFSVGRRTRSTSTTCRRRSCTCSASTTRS